jgi:elongator complex protein 3
MPKSYLSNEPAIMRAIVNKFDPYKQTFNRIKDLKISGHPTDKIELIVIGGTWSFLPTKYREWFIKRAFNAANGKTSKTLKQAQAINEKTNNRIIGLTVETRPDFINEKEIIMMRELGVTRVEMGIQSIYDNVLKINKRGHSVKKSIEATKLLKEAGFKI